MLNVTPELQSRLVTAVAEALIAHADELCRLDRAIGDGDHGINLKRGFEAVLAEEPLLATQPLPQALHAIGLRLVMSVGGASGPLYGTLFMSLGEALSRAHGAQDFASALGLAVQAVCARGRSHAGQKSLLDVLVPLQAHLAGSNRDIPYAQIKSLVNRAAESTIGMKAACGRAAFLGERSVGHMDPGARSAALMVGAVCDVLGGDTQSC